MVVVMMMMDQVLHGDRGGVHVVQHPLHALPFPLRLLLLPPRAAPERLTFGGRGAGVAARGLGGRRGRGPDRGILRPSEAALQDGEA